MNYLRKCIGIAIVSFIAFSALIWPGQVFGVGNTTVGVSAQGEAVSSGSQFTIDILVQPGSAIAGAQFNLTFDPSLVTVNSVTEGNLFKQNGANTYFVPGQINNNTGTVSGVCGVITTPGQTISSVGTLAIIACTARSATGTSRLELFNVVVGDSNGKAISLNVVNGQVSVNSSPTSPTPTPTLTSTPAPVPPPPSSTPSAPPASGGISGERQYLTEYMTQPGVFNQDVFLKSYDGILNLSIPGNTTVKTAEGWALSYIVLKPVESENQRPLVQDGNIVGLSYSLGPEGTVFDPPITISIVYDPAKIPARILETSLVIGYWNDTKGRWIALDNCQVDIARHNITAPLSHFSSYAVIGYPLKVPAPIANNMSTSTTSASLPQYENNPLNTPPQEINPAPTTTDTFIETNEYTAVTSFASDFTPEIADSQESNTPVSPTYAKEISLSLLAKITSIAIALSALVTFAIIYIRHHLFKK